MSLFYVIFVVFVAFVAAGGSGRIFPSNPTGIEFYDFIVKVTGVKKPITSCTITYNFDRYENYVLLDRKHPQDDNVTYVDNWEEGECGVHFRPLTRDRTGRWDFKVKNGDGVAEIYTATVAITDEGEQFQPESKKVQIGDPVTIKCSSSYSWYAKLYDTNGKLVKEGSEATIRIEQARFEDNGIWKCILLFRTSFSQRSYDINIEVFTPEATENAANSEKTETDAHLNFLWKFKDFRIINFFFERPDGKIITPQEGVLFENYNYFGQGTDLKEYGISIAKPLTSEDIGFWKTVPRLLDNYGNDREKYCGFFHVGNTSHSEDINKLSIPVATTTKNLRLLKGSDGLTIQCSARSSIKHCYLRSPSGKMYDFTYFRENNGYSLARNPNLKFGKCEGYFPTRSFDTTATGSWICGMGVEGLAQDLQIPVDVLVSDRKMTTNSSHISGKIGSPVNIILTSLKGFPLFSCRFNRPDGYGINVNALRNTTNMNYSEAGKGLGNGDCGLLIKSLKNEDLGTWVVTVLIRKETAEDYYEINISPNKEGIDL